MAARTSRHEARQSAAKSKKTEKLAETKGASKGDKGVGKALAELDAACGVCGHDSDPEDDPGIVCDGCQKGVSRCASLLVALPSLPL